MMCVTVARAGISFLVRGKISRDTVDRTTVIKLIVKQSKKSESVATVNDGPDKDESTGNLYCMPLDVFCSPRIPEHVYGSIAVATTHYGSMLAAIMITSLRVSLC